MRIGSSAPGGRQGLVDDAPAFADDGRVEDEVFAGGVVFEPQGVARVGRVAADGEPQVGGGGKGAERQPAGVFIGAVPRAPGADRMRGEERFAREPAAALGEMPLRRGRQAGEGRADAQRCVHRRVAERSGAGACAPGDVVRSTRSRA
jgi:hypothetical protein